MTAWLLDTLLMTGFLMGLVLLVRKPVGRWFGPKAAYALWALPMIRLFLPPLVLPEAAVAPRPSLQFVPMPDEKLILVSFPAEPATPMAMPVETQPAGLLESLPWSQILLTVWLAGAAIFLLHRFVAYHAMRAELLRGSRRVGHSGNVRIVESPAVAAPLAFGVFDRVVALPAGFLATADSDVSDFAIAHELEHHAGNDLVANFAVQPLFALHWFNPIGWMAWRSLRSDQEAACDARVMAGRGRAERERYGRLIAEFAVGPRLALAAPMAGPLRGDKPIIHRLKALVRNDVSERRKLLGRSLFAMAVIGVPATATVTYAAVESDEAPESMAARDPRTEHAALTGRGMRTIVKGNWAADCPEGRHDTDCLERADHGPTFERHVEHNDTVYRLLTSEPMSDEQALAEIDRAESESARAERESDWAEREADRAEQEADRAERDADRAERDADRLARRQERLAARMEKEADRAERDAERRARDIERDAERRARDIEREADRIERRAEAAAAMAPTVEHSMSSDGKVQTIRIASKDSTGKHRLVQKMVIDSSCAAGSRAHASARDSHGTMVAYICAGAPNTAGYVRQAMSQARAQIVANGAIPASVRAQVLSNFDREMVRAEAEAD
ncbi:M56 family metallopeptidase [Novosphingobium aquimarinum]|uniref:M56 family metallopeptidase n=1 Tax=Novosphingobium aquimarinum TaxID=2682494 RepID=UPI0012EB76F0|nr:M56 family metallopeptidase [Novosphingobium aquimarinum]